MKKILMVAVFLGLLSALYANADDVFAPNEGPWARIRLSGLLLGYFAMGWEWSGAKEFWGDPFNELSLSLELRPFNRLGFELYADVKGYRWRDMDPAYELGMIWGLPGFKIGASVIYHFLDASALFDIAVGFGAEYAHYIYSEIDFYPGFGLSARVAFIWRPVVWLGLGIEGAAHWSTHAGGPIKIDPGWNKLPFELYELACGVVVAVYF